MTLRQRLRKRGINCLPWRLYRGEIQTLCVSGQCLFRGDGEPIDTLEMELRETGWLFEWENLWDCLINNDRLMMGKIAGDSFPDNEGDYPEDWTEGDFKANGF